VLRVGTGLHGFFDVGRLGARSLLTESTNIIHDLPNNHSISNEY
jgi:hypothetical protein